MHFNYRIFIYLFLMLASFSLYASEKKILTKQNLKQWASFLASNEMRGRKNNSKEIMVAAKWIKNKFNHVSLKIPPKMNNMFQTFHTRDGGKLINIIGYIEGVDKTLKKDVIILSAHYDHIGTEGDVIFNGPDDDVSGIITLLGIAKKINEKKHTNKRSILFIAYSGEELGLYGSKYYVQHPAMPLKNTMVNLNFEMVGRTENLGKKQFWITGAEYSNLYTVLQKRFKKYKWKVRPSPFPEMQLFFRSDNASFINLAMDRTTKTVFGVPAHSISTWGKEGHYHQPTDDANALDFDNIFEFISNMSKEVIYLANNKNIHWNSMPKVKFRHIREKSH